MAAIPHVERDCAHHSQTLARALLCMVAMAFACTNSGCISAMANMINVIKGSDFPAEFDDLKEKKVAVIASTESGINSDASGILMSRLVHTLLSQNVKKIEMINPEEVDRIVSDQPSDAPNFAQIGRRLGADYVIAVDVSDLKLHDGQTLYKGRSNSSIAAYKVTEGNRPVFKKAMPGFVFPQTGVPITDQDEATFQRFYLAELASRLARHFYPYDPTTDVAKEATVASYSAFR